MGRWDIYLQQAITLTEQYDASAPFAQWLKSFFSANHKFGSGDRRHITALCYAFYRCGHALDDLDKQEAMLAAYFLCASAPDHLLATHQPDWNKQAGAPLADKLELLAPHFKSGLLFPAQPFLSPDIQIQAEAFALSHLRQPDLFIRVRKGYEHAVRKKLVAANMVFEWEGTAAFRLPNGAKIENILDIGREAIVQDLSSQRTGDLLLQCTGATRVWDCCAGSGGKSIMACDLLPGIELTATDIRSSILKNLRHRFELAGIQQYRAFETDLDRPNANIRFPNPFQLIIADVPCTGSGTWGRAPEHLYYFQPEAIDRYVQLQKTILSNAIPHLSTGGKLLYITCSVFRQENEEIVAFIEQDFGLKPVAGGLLEGYEVGADTMFACLMERG